MKPEKATLTGQDLREGFRCIAAAMEANREWLCQLDSEMGDGDLGLTMAKGFKAVVASLEAVDPADISMQLETAAETMGETVASTMGTLLSSGFSSAAMACRGKSNLSVADVAAMARGFAAGVARRGKAKAGDKTILDSITPAADALERAAQDPSISASAALKLAAAAAEKGVADSTALQSRHGRAARYLEQSKGRVDGGAVAGSLIFAGFANV